MQREHHEAESERAEEEAIAAQISALLADRSAWPDEVKPGDAAGIVISGCTRLFRPLYANLLNIRQLGCTKSIVVCHLPGEFAAPQIARLSPFATVQQFAGTPFDALSGKHEVHGFKAWILAHSPFKKTLLLDANSFPLLNLDLVFEAGQKCILWRSGWRHFIDRLTRVRRLLSTTEPAYEFESGQLFVDREESGVREAVRLAAALNRLGRKLYQITYGDKETYALAFDLLHEAYTAAPAPVINPPCGEARPRALVQPWLDGRPLLYHPLAQKDGWWRFRPEWAALDKEARRVEEACADGPGPS